MDPPSDIVSKVTEGNILKVDHEMDYPVPNDGKMLTLFPICNLRLYFPHADVRHRNCKELLN